jgi:hypothetical protein
LLFDLLRDAEARVRCGEAADRWMTSHRGALRRTADLVRTELAPRL